MLVLHLSDEAWQNTAHLYHLFTKWKT